MAVVYLTKNCTLKCNYCFDKIQQLKAIDSNHVFISDDMFKLSLKRAIETYKNKPIYERSICLSGGEPTIHPNFKIYVNEILRSWMKIHLLTNFTFSQDICNFIKSKKDKISFLVNINDPNRSEYNWMTQILWERILSNLDQLQSNRLQVSLNVWNPAIEYDFIFDILDKYSKIDKRLRIWILNPMVTEIKETVFEWATWVKYKMLWKKIDNIVEKVYNKGYSVFMDCWAWLCIFSWKTKSLIFENWEWNKCTIPIPWIKLNGSYETCYVMVDAFNEDQKLNIENNSISNYINIWSLRTEFYKNFHLTLPKCQSCSLFYDCSKFCTSNSYSYWWKYFENKSIDDIMIKIKQNLKEENNKIIEKWKKQNKMIQIERDSNLKLNYIFSAIEYFISKEQYSFASLIIYHTNKISVEDDIKNEISIKLSVYESFLGILIWKISKVESIKQIEQIKQNTIDDIYIQKLCNFFLITLKKLK